jgi:hypothetical protein
MKNDYAEINASPLLPPPQGNSAASTTSSAAWYSLATKKLESLSRLPEGWDSYSGLPLSHAARLRVDQFLDLVKHRELPDPEIVLGSSGNVNLEWRVNGRELEIGISDLGDFEFTKVDEQGGVEEGQFDGEVPERPIALIDWLSRG